MNYFDLNDDLNERSTSNLPTTSVVANQQTKDLSDWRNIQLGTTPTILDRFWTPTTVNPWTATNTPLYPHPSTYQWTNVNNNQSWPLTPFPTNPGLPLMNFNSPPLQNFLPTETTNDIIDLTINTSTPIRFVWKTSFFPPIDFLHFRDFIPVQPNPFFQPPPPTPSSPPQATVTEAELILVPEIDIEEILGQVEAVIPDIDLDAARRTVTAMNPIPSTNDIVTHFLDNGYTRKCKKSSDSDRHLSLKRSWSEIMDDIPKFLSSYSDPISFFFDTQRKQSESYINHAKAFLLRAFPSTDKSILEQALTEENFHFLPTIRKLERQLGIRNNTFLQRTAIRKSIDMLGRFFKKIRSIN